MRRFACYYGSMRLGKPPVKRLLTPRQIIRLVKAANLQPAIERLQREGKID